MTEVIFLSRETRVRIPFGNMHEGTTASAHRLQESKRGNSSQRGFWVRVRKWMRQEKLIVFLTITVWLFWKAHPSLLICTLFWLDVIWIIHAKRLLRGLAGFIILLGVALNAVVTEANGGVMPVVGMPKNLRSASPVWCGATAHHHFLILADHAAMRFFSVGDLLLLAGASAFLLARLYRAFKKYYSAVRRSGQCGQGSVGLVDSERSNVV